jgi:membrane protein
MRAGTIGSLLKATYSGWSEDNAPRLAGSLAFSTVFALAPLLIIVLGLAGLAFGREAAQSQIVEQISMFGGAQTAGAIQDLLDNIDKPETSTLATAIGVATFLLGAWWVFTDLQDAFNTIWGVKPVPGRHWLTRLRDRVLSFTMMLGINFLLLVSLLVSAALAAAAAYLRGLLSDLGPALQVINFLISFGVVTLLFAMMYKIIPDVKLAWGDVWIGAAVTALLFSLGKFAIGLYLGTSTLASAYGAAGSLVVILVWVYYSAQILFLGAEFTKVYARCCGTRIVPEDYATPVTEEARARQGMVSKEQIEEAAQLKEHEVASN